MIERILRTVGTSAVAVVLATVVGIIFTPSANASAVFIVPSDTSVGTPQDVDSSTVIVAQNGQGPLTTPDGNLLDGTLNGGDTFTDTFYFDVSTSGGQPISYTYDVTQDLPQISSVGIANLSFEWDGIAASIVTLTSSTGVANLNTNVIFSRFLAFGAHTLVVTGTVLSNGGDYTAVISPVPLPAAALLFGSVLLGGGLMRRRKMIKEFGLPI